MTSSLEPLMVIWPNSTGMVPGWFPTKIVQMVLIGYISRSRAGWPRSLEIRENRENGPNKFPAGKNQGISKFKKNQGIIREFYKKWRKEMCLPVASLHAVYQIDLFHQTDCKQYAFYCSLNNWVNICIWCIWHSIPCSTKSLLTYMDYEICFCHNYVLMMVIKTEL